jgi:glycosyltransferase involved in cell wall biosynthesis
MAEKQPDSAQRLAVVYLGYRGGGARFCLDLTRGLAARAELQVYGVLIRNTTLLGEYAFLRGRVCLMPGAATVGQLLLNSLAYPFQLVRIARFLRGNRIDAVLFGMHHPWNAGVMLVCRLLRIPYVYVIHDAILHAGENTLVRRWVLHTEIALSRRFVCLSETVRRQFQQIFRIDPSRVCLVPHGAPAGGLQRQAPAAAPGPLRVLFFGRLVAYKGLELLQQSLELLRAAAVPFELRIAGEGVISPRVAAMRAWGNVEIADRFIDEAEVEVFFAWADVLVVPYIEASQSGVVPLAFSYGVPVLCTPVGGLSEQVKHQQDGLLAREVTAEAIASGLRSLHEDRRLLQRLGEGAAHTAATELSWAQVVGPLVPFLMARPG